jgi:hypothetical protein
MIGFLDAKVRILTVLLNCPIRADVSGSSTGLADIADLLRRQLAWDLDTGRCRPVDTDNEVIDVRRGHTAYRWTNQLTVLSP